jgi:cullin 2
MYESFYGAQFSGRKLTWLHYLSNGDIKLGYLGKTYIVNMTTFQMSVLLLYEKSDSLSYSELAETTKIAPDQFPRYLQSLLDAKLLNCSTEVSEKRNQGFKYLYRFGFKGPFV